MFTTKVSPPPGLTPDPALEILKDREIRALKFGTAVRAVLISLMLPTAWLFGANQLDKVATSFLLLIYIPFIGLSTYWLSKGRHLHGIGLVGAILDVVVISTLPYIWLLALGGSSPSPGIMLKSSVTLMSLLMIALNTMPMRALYPALVTVGAVIVHAVLLSMAIADPSLVIGDDYIAAYESGDIATGRVATQLVVLVLAGGILTLLATRAREMVVEAAQLQKTTVQMSRYFSPSMVKQLGSSRELLKVGAERKELSFVFTDLEGFTTLVESNSPSLIMPILNGYLEELTEVAFRHDGTLDKIVGDALHVIFGAPMTQVNHAERAMACALEIDRVAEGYRKKVSSTVTLGITRIGVNTGYAVVGNFGSDDYFDYTAHGDAINIAARLEGANKYLLTRICVSQETVAQLEKFDGRSIGTMMLVGKKSGVQVFDATPVDNKAQQDLEAYSEAWFAMASGHSNALEMFSAYCQMYPQDGLAAFHLRRLQQGKCGVTIYLDGK